MNDSTAKNLSGKPRKPTQLQAHHYAIIDAYLAGDTAARAAARYGFCRGVAEKALHSAGISTRTADRRKQLEKEAAEGFRVCLHCKMKKPLDEFNGSRRRVGGVTATCHDCQSNRHGSIQRYKIPAIEISVPTSAYLAALIDGEGCISLVKSKSRSSSKAYYSARISIGMTGDALIGLWREIGIGRMYTIIGRKAYGKRPIHAWQIGSNALRALMPFVLPFLRFKKRQAELLDEYLKLAAHKTRRPGDLFGQHLSRTEEIYREIRSLNFGPNSTSRPPDDVPDGNASWQPHSLDMKFPGS